MIDDIKKYLTEDGVRNQAVIKAALFILSRYTKAGWLYSAVDALATVVPALWESGDTKKVELESMDLVDRWKYLDELIKELESEKGEIEKQLKKDFKNF